MSCIATFEVKMTKPATRARARAQSDKLLGGGSAVALLQHRDRPACARRLGRRADELQRRRRLLPLLPTTPAPTQTHTRTCLSAQLLQLDSTPTTYLRAGARSIVGSRACTSTRRMSTSALRFAARSRTYPSGSARSSGRLRHARCRCGGGHVLCAPVAVIYARPPSCSSSMPTLCGAERDLAERDEHVAHGVLRDVLRGRDRAAHHVLVLGPREDELRRRLLRANHAAPCRATTHHAQFQGRARDARETPATHPRASTRRSRPGRPAPCGAGPA